MPAPLKKVVQPAMRTIRQCDKKKSMKQISVMVGGQQKVESRMSNDQSVEIKVSSWAQLILLIVLMDLKQIQNQRSKLCP
jgi:hypothetical protein